jgi:hypothetical protein
MPRPLAGAAPVAGGDAGQRMGEAIQGTPSEAPHRSPIGVENGGSRPLARTHSFVGQPAALPECRGVSGHGKLTDDDARAVLIVNGFTDPTPADIKLLQELVGEAGKDTAERGELKWMWWNLTSSHKLKWELEQAAYAFTPTEEDRETIRMAVDLLYQDTRELVVPKTVARVFKVARAAMQRDGTGGVAPRASEPRPGAFTRMMQASPPPKRAGRTATVMAAFGLTMTQRGLTFDPQLGIFYRH